jgi:hypothetical protein
MPHLHGSIALATVIEQAHAELCFAPAQDFSSHQHKNFPTLRVEVGSGMPAYLRVLAAGDLRAGMSVLNEDLQTTAALLAAANESYCKTLGN